MSSIDRVNSYSLLEYPSITTGVEAGLSELEYYLITVRRTILRDFERDFGRISTSILE